MDSRIIPLWIMPAPDHSGMSVANRHLCAGMDRIGFRPEIYAVRDGENAADFRAVGCPVRIFPHLGGALFGGSAIREASAAGVSLVHALSADMVWRGERMSKRLGVPLLVTANRLEESQLRGLARFRGQGVVAVSGAILERMVNVSGIPRDRIRVIHNGLDLTRLPRPSFTDNTAGGPVWRTPVIGTLGHLSEKKGQRVFLQAVKILMDKGLDAEFVILGDGPDRPALRVLADELNVTKRVTFTPQTVSGQVNQLDILVEPSLQEGLGVSVMQAMAMGVPVVATGVGGLYDLIEDGKTGLMVKASDPQDLADAIWRLLNNPAQRLEMAKQAREMIERDFSADTVAEKLVDYYRDCLEHFHGWGSRKGTASLPGSFRP